MSTTPTAYMSLPVPDVGAEDGPQYAIDVNDCMTLIDQHTHLPGSGVPIVSAALNINGDIGFNNYNITGLKTARFQSQNTPIPASGADLGCLFESGVDLYYNDGAGNQIRLTQSGGVVGTPGSISGLVAPASATYVPLNETFVWQSAANTSATMDSGPIILRLNTASSDGITITPPLTLASDYTITLPALPLSEKIMTLDASGNILAHWTVDNSTIVVSSLQLKAQAAGLADGVTIEDTGSNTLAVRHGDREHAWELNGDYPVLTYPLLNIDAVFIAPYNITITSVWLYNGTAGASGTTEFDLKVATTSGGSYTTILSTTGKVTSAAASGVWTDSGSVIGVQTGVTKPVLSTTAIAAGSAIRWDLIQSMAASAADARIRIFYKQS